METWKAVVGYEGFYEVSDKGQVRSLDREIAHPKGGVSRLKGKVIAARGLRGYWGVNLAREGTIRSGLVHRLVLEAFVGPPGKDACLGCHNNGDPKDNRVENLRWDTPAGNQADKSAHGTLVNGEAHYSAKLTCEDVREIRKKLARGFSAGRIAPMFGVSQRAISKIRNGESWTHVQ